MSFPRHDLHVLSGAYALDALDGAEQDSFERHLHRCQPCSAEMRGLRETAGRLAIAAAVVAPARLRAQVLAAVARTRQLPPLSGQPPGPRRRTSWVPRLALPAAIGALAIVLVLVLGLVQARTQHRLQQAQAQAGAIAAVLAAPDVRIVRRPTSVGGLATAVVSAAEHKMIFTTAGLPPLPAGKVYQLWLLGPGRIRSAGLLPPSAAGRTAPLLASGVTSRDQVGVTVEPAGGTAKPTTGPILVMAVSR